MKSSSATRGIRHLFNSSQCRTRAECRDRSWRLRIFRKTWLFFGGPLAPHGVRAGPESGSAARARRRDPAWARDCTALNGVLSLLKRCGAARRSQPPFPKAAGSGSLGSQHRRGTLEMKRGRAHHIGCVPVTTRARSHRGGAGVYHRSIPCLECCDPGQELHIFVKLSQIRITAASSDSRSARDARGIEAWISASLYCWIFSQLTDRTSGSILSRDITSWIARSLRSME
jgi:hypothetical protein